MPKLKLAGAGLCAVIFAAGYGLAGAAPAPVDPERVQSLAAQIETALGGMGCSASSKQDMATIQSTIAVSGATPAEAEAALSLVEGSAGICPNAKVAAATVSQQIQLAMNGGPPGAGGGPGGGGPIGAPPAYVSGGGSDYLVR
jgi:hypothetical protein